MTDPQTRECPECGRSPRWQVSAHRRECTMAWAFGDEVPARADLLAWRERLIAEGIDPALLLVPDRAAQPAPLDERYRALVTFVADRLVHVYGESPNTDYIIGLREAASAPLPSVVDITGIDPIIRAADERYRALVGKLDAMNIGGHPLAGYSAQRRLGWDEAMATVRALLREAHDD